MSQGSYTGNVGVKGIFPLPDPTNTGCFRFTDKSTTGCERSLYQQYWQEQISLYGQKVSYYVHNYNTLSADNFYGEQPTQQFSAPQTIVMAINLNENALLLSKYGLMSDDEVTAFVPYSAFWAAYGAGTEPKAEDVFSLTEYGSDRPDGRGPNSYVVTQRLDQDIAQINPLMGHYVWMIKAKRFEFSFEPGAPQEAANNQVFDDTVPTSTDGTAIYGASKPYNYDVDVDIKNNVFDYTNTNEDSVYGGYIGYALNTIPTPVPTVSGTIGYPTNGPFTSGQIYYDSANALWQFNGAVWMQMQPAPISAINVLSSYNIPTNYLITITSQNWAQYFWTGTVWQPVNLQP